MQSNMDLHLALSQSNDSNAEYTFASPRPQQFSLPYPIIKYVFSKSSSGKAWKKLIQTCKYFYSMYSIYPVEYLKYDYGKWKADEEIFDSTKNIAELWIYDQIDVYSFEPTMLSSLISKMDKCNLRFLDIFRQNLTYDEYVFLISSGDLKQLQLSYCTIKHSDGTLVTFDLLFGNIPELEYFQMYCAENSSSMFQGITFKKFADILPCLKELSHFNLYSLTEEFDFATIIDFILKNERMLICLNYDVHLSDAYKEILESFIAKIIETPPKRIPYIKFPGFENSIYYDDYRKLYDLRK